jgi:hypothetical protein
VIRVDDELRKLLDELDALEAEMTKGDWELTGFGDRRMSSKIAGDGTMLAECDTRHFGTAQNHRNALGIVRLRNSYKALAKALRDMDDRITELQSKANPPEAE